MTLTIVGAGMAGLLAGNMLARRRPLLVEQQKTLPNNHSAVLRFRTTVVGDILGIPFRPVSMIKAALPWQNVIADSLAYSHKNSGILRSDRSITQGLVSETRYIAPPDFISKMAEGCGQTTFSTPCSFSGPGPYVSTLPMEQLMRLVDYPLRNEVKFSWREGRTIRAKVADCDAYVSLLVPSPQYVFSRVSITGDELIVEIPSDETCEIGTAAELLGIDTKRLSEIRAKKQHYAKIVPIDDASRREFIHWATIERNIFALGRFATWRPGLLLDSLVQDIRLIDGWLDHKTDYSITRRR